MGHILDVSDQAAVNRVFDDIKASGATVDVLVNNAGVVAVGSILVVSVWSSCFRLVVRACILALSNHGVSMYFRVRLRLFPKRASVRLSV